MTDPVVQGLVWYVAFLASVTVHEAAHAWAALRGGDPTAYLGGQVSIDPMPHIRREPFGMVVLPILSLVLFGWPFGFASTPYDPAWAAAHPRRAAWMSLAGPLANLALVLAAALAIRLGVAAGGFFVPPALGLTEVVLPAGPGLWAGAALMLSVFFSLNLILVVLNLIPVPPLDGAGALGLVLPGDLTRRYQALASQPLFSLLGLLVAWNLFGRLFRPVFHTAVGLLHPELAAG